MNRYIAHFSALNIHVLRPSVERKVENSRYFDCCWMDQVSAGAI